MATFTFDSVDEIRAFVKDHLKGTRRGGKGDDGDEGTNTNPAPAPIMPPVTTTHQGFAGPPAGFGGGASGFPGHMPAVAPEVTALVTKINSKIDGSLAAGNPQGPMLDWFRQHCGAEAAGATIEQIKTVFLPKMSIPVLENIVKLTGS